MRDVMFRWNHCTVFVVQGGINMVGDGGDGGGGGVSGDVVGC